nr:hypothetical protein [Tanacetum cinerariifolium]
MSSASSAITYTSVYIDSEPGRVFWGADEELSDDSPPRVIVYGYDGLPMQPVALPSPDYIHGPEEPHDPYYMPKLIYLRYVAESDLEEDLEEYEDDETEDGLVDYPMDGGDDGDDDDDDSSGNHIDDEDDDEKDKEEEEHLAPADSVVVIPSVELVSLPEGTEPASIPLPPEAEVKRLLAMPTPPPSPLTSLSPPTAGERMAMCTAPSAHLSPSPVPSPLLPSSGYPTKIQTLKIASTQALIDAVTATLPSPPLPPLPPPVYIPPPVGCLRYEVGKSSTARPTEGRWIEYGFVSTLDAETRRRGIGEVGYGIRDTWVDPSELVPEIALMTLGEVNTRVTELAKLHEHDTHNLYALLEDAQEGRTRIS